MSQMLSSLSTNEDSHPNSMPDLMPLMQNIMQRLISKDLLYPSLKEVVEKVSTSLICFPISMFPILSIPGSSFQRGCLKIGRTSTRRIVIAMIGNMC